MARPLRTPLLLLAILAVTLAVTLAMPLAKNSKGVVGIEKADVNDEGVQRELDFAISKYNMRRNDSSNNVLDELFRIFEQAVVKLYLDTIRTT
ncbi:cystatin-C-like [Microcebus murinus]|uniref:cystatin-C-like n=1 Tax=Microcebus murinus TaxID=30608 RepID=UPI003F6CCB49